MQKINGNNNRMSRRELARTHNQLIQRFNRVAMLCKIIMAGLYVENEKHVFLDPNSGVSTQAHIDEVKMWIEKGEYKGVMQMVDRNLEEAKDEKSKKDGEGAGDKPEEVAKPGFDTPRSEKPKL